MNNTIFLTAADIAGTLKISKALAYRLIAEGQIPALRIGKSVRVRSEDLEKYIQSNISGGGFPDHNFDLLVPKQPRKIL